MSCTTFLTFLFQSKTGRDMMRPHLCFQTLNSTFYNTKDMSDQPQAAVIIHFEFVSLKPGLVWQLPMMNMN